MAHKTLVGGTAYNITGGKSLVSGTAYDIKGGRTLISGTGYDIKFSRDPAYAMVYSDNSMVFQRGNEIETGKTLLASYTGFEEEEYTSSPWEAYRSNIVNVFFKDKVTPTSIACWFRNHNSLKNMNVANLNLAKTTNMSYAFATCYNLVGSPICGINVVNMIDTYSRCYNLTGSPICGSNVVNMHGAYYFCNNLTGSPVCGENVNSMYGTYQECRKLTGSPVCGLNVVNLVFTYYNCFNLTGSPVCGNNVINMYGAYYYCNNIIGNPICGSKVTNIKYAYYKSGSQNTGKNAYFYSASITNVQLCFGGKNYSKRLNIYVPMNSTTNTSIHYTNSSSLVGATITWTNAGTYQYNTAYNLYIYPVANVAAAAIANGDEEANANAGITT